LVVHPLIFLNTCYFSGHCKTLAPEYVKAAKKLAENTPPYYIAKVDATENKKVAERFGVKGFPTLKFFK
jgi:thiol-disulfide isomerase/thioredoxin